MGVGIYQGCGVLAQSRQRIPDADLTVKGGYLILRSFWAGRDMMPHP